MIEGDRVRFISDDPYSRFKESLEGKCGFILEINTLDPELVLVNVENSFIITTKKKYLEVIQEIL
jgi:hypothetical protein